MRKRNLEKQQDKQRNPSK